MCMHALKPYSTVIYHSNSWVTMHGVFVIQLFFNLLQISKHFTILLLKVVPSKGGWIISAGQPAREKATNIAKNNLNLVKVLNLFNFEKEPYPGWLKCSEGPI